MLRYDLFRLVLQGFSSFVIVSVITLEQLAGTAFVSGQYVAWFG